MARRDDREYREYLSEEQRSQRGCIARRMQPDFRHGLLASRCFLSGCFPHQSPLKLVDQRIYRLFLGLAGNGCGCDRE